MEKAKIGTRKKSEGDGLPIFLSEAEWIELHRRIEEIPKSERNKLLNIYLRTGKCIKMFNNSILIIKAISDDEPTMC